jgi:hypothetical protein
MCPVKLNMTFIKHPSWVVSFQEKKEIKKKYCLFIYVASLIKVLKMLKRAWMCRALLFLLLRPSRFWNQKRQSNDIHDSCFL